MSRALISIGLLLATACGSDAEPSSTPTVASTPGTGGSTGSETVAGPVSSNSATTGGQSTIGSGNTGAQSTTGSETTSGQTSTMSATTSGQTSTAAASTGGQSATTTTTTTTTTTGEPTPTPLSFASDIWPVWSTLRDPVFVYRGMGSYSGCTDVGVCHGGVNPGAGLSMPDAETAYAQLIDTPSVSSICAGTQRVVVGDPENSCVVLFYVGRLGREDLDWVDDAEIELMREWIRQGALP